MKRKPNPVWRKVPRTVGLYEFKPSGTYFANIRHDGKLYRESLKTSDLAFAKRKLHDFKQRLQRTDPRFGKISFVAWLKGVYLLTLKGSESLQERVDEIKRGLDKPVQTAEPSFGERLKDATKHRLAAFRGNRILAVSAEDDSFGEKLKRAVKHKQEQRYKPSPQPSEAAKQERSRWLRLAPRQPTKSG